MPTKRTISILAFEDNEQVLAVLREAFSDFGDEAGYDIRLTSIPTVREAEGFLLTYPDETYDAVLLDRNDADGESFHTLDLARFGTDKIVSISSVPRHNAAARARGVLRAVLKDYADLPVFALKVVSEVAGIVGVVHILA